MFENSTDLTCLPANRWVIACLIILPFIAVAGCSKSPEPKKPAEEARPPVVQDMNIVAPESSD